MADPKEEKQPANNVEYVGCVDYQVPMILDSATEARIRALIREELAAFVRRQRLQIRQSGLRPDMETK